MSEEAGEQVLESRGVCRAVVGSSVASRSVGESETAATGSVEASTTRGNFDTGVHGL